VLKGFEVIVDVFLELDAELLLGSESAQKFQPLVQVCGLVGGGG